MHPLCVCHIPCFLCRKVSWIICCIDLKNVMGDDSLLFGPSYVCLGEHASMCKVIKLVGGQEIQKYCIHQILGTGPKGLNFHGHQ